MTHSEAPPPRRPPVLVVVARVALLLLALAFVAAGALVARRGGEPSPTGEGYSCPMHAEVVSSDAGECPICHMALEPRGGRAPVEQAQISSAPKPPSPSTPTVPAATRASPLGVTWLPETFPPAANAEPGDGPRLARPARRTFSESIRAPAWVEAPGRLVALLYRDELVGLASAERGTFFRSLAPKTPVPVRLAEDPQAPWDSSTVLVRFALAASASENPEHEADRAVNAGDVGVLELPAVTRELLVFPESALLRSSEGPYVLVADGKTLARRPVQIGRLRKGRVVVLGGLADDDAVVVGNAFFFDTHLEREPLAGAVAEVVP